MTQGVGTGESWASECFNSTLASAIPYHFSKPLSSWGGLIWENTTIGTLMPRPLMLTFQLRSLPGPLLNLHTISECDFSLNINTSETSLVWFVKNHSLKISYMYTMEYIILFAPASHSNSLHVPPHNVSSQLYISSFFKHIPPSLMSAVIYLWVWGHSLPGSQPRRIILPPPAALGCQ